MPRVIYISAGTSTVAVSPAVIANDGVESATITVRVLDDRGEPVAGFAAANIVLASTGTGNTITQPTGATNQDGVITGSIVSTVSAIKTISATVAGLAVTDTASLNVGGVLSLVFASDWGTATGTTDAALRDTDQTLPWETLVTGNTNRDVIASTGLDFPSTNVLRVGTQWNGSGSAAFIPRITEELPALGIGNSRYYRWYIRWVVPTSLTTWGTPHPIQDGPDAATGNWLFESRRGTGGTKVTIGWNPPANTFPNNRWWAIDALDIDTTYRVELKATRTGTTTFTLDARVYNTANTLLLDGSDFLNQEGLGSTSLADVPSLTMRDVTQLRSFQVGTNGAFQGTTSGDHPVDFCYQGCVAISDETWCGAYVNGEGP
jgi:hypothetical protein